MNTAILIDLNKLHSLFCFVIDVFKKPQKKLSYFFKMVTLLANETNRRENVTYLFYFCLFICRLKTFQQYTLVTLFTCII